MITIVEPNTGGVSSPVTITSGSITGLTTFGLRDTSAAFDVRMVATSTTPLTANRTLTLDVNNAAQTLKFTAASVVTFPSGTNTLLGSAVANTISVNGAASTPPLTLTGTWFTGGSATTTKPQFLIEPAGTTSTGWSTLGTGLGVNSPATSNDNASIADFQFAGVSSFRVSRYAVSFGGFMDFKSGSTTVFAMPAAGQIQMDYRAFYGWATTPGSTSNADTRLYRDEAVGVLALRKDVTAQTFRVYGTADTHPTMTNYVRASLSATSTTVTLAAETAGTGAGNVPIALIPAGTGLIGINGLTSAFPALKRNGVDLQCRLADDSGYAEFSAAQYFTGAAHVTGATAGPFTVITSIEVIGGIVVDLQGS